MGVKNFLPEELQADDLAPGLRTLAYLNPGGFLPAPRSVLEPRRAGTRRLCVVRRSRCPHGNQTFLNMVRTPDSANLTLTVAHVVHRSIADYRTQETCEQKPTRVNVFLCAQIKNFGLCHFSRLRTS